MRVECSCGKALKVADEMAGKKIRCPACKEIVPIPEMEEAKEPKTKAIKKASAASPAGKSKPSKPARAQEEEDEDGEETPKKAKKAGAGKKGKGKELSPVVIWGSIAAAVLLLGGGGLAFYLLRDKDKPAQNPPPNGMAMRPGQGGMPPGGMPPGMQMPPGGQFPPGMQMPPGGQFPPGFQMPPDGKLPPGFPMPPGGQFPGGNVPPGGQPKEDAAIPISIDQLFKEYDINKDATIKKYQGKVLILEGPFENYTDRTSKKGSAYLDAPAKNGQERGFSCHLAENMLPKVVNLSKGQKVKFKGRFEEGIADLMLRDAELVFIGPDPAIPISSAQLAKECAANAEATEKKYKDRVLLVEGTVVEVKKPPTTGNADDVVGILVLESFDEKVSKPFRVECSFTKDGEDKYVGVKKGDKIKFKGAFQETKRDDDDKPIAASVLANYAVR